MAWRDNARGNIIDLRKSMGDEVVMQIIVEAIQKDEFTDKDFSVREMWDGFTDYADPQEIHLINSYEVMGAPIRTTKREAVTTGSFIRITGELINKKIIEGYDAPDYIGDSLVTTVPSKLKKEYIAGFTDLELPDEIPEHHPYGSSGFEEKYVTVVNKKYGKIIDLTDEVILFDQTGQLLSRAKNIGEGLKYKKEEIILDKIQDINTDSWAPSDTATALYSTTNLNLVASNPFGSPGLAAVKKQSTMMQSDSEDTKYMMVSLRGKPLLVPEDLEQEAWELATSLTQPETAERAPNFWQARYVPYTSPFITKQSTTTWFWGDFKKVFIWTEVFPLQTFTAKPGNEEEFNRDVKARFKARFMGGCACLDPKFVFKATA